METVAAQFPFVTLKLNQSNLEMSDACREAVDRFLKTPSYTLATNFISTFGASVLECNDLRASMIHDPLILDR